MKVDEAKPVEPATPTARHGTTVTAGEHELRGRDRPSHRAGDAGAADEREPPEDIAAFHGLTGDDLTDRARVAMMELIEEIAALRQELTRNRKQLDYLSDLADRDPLSNVLNRRAFVRELAHAQRLGQEFHAANTLLFLTVDNLKAVNDERGHAVGDAVIERVAQSIRGAVADADVVGRLGGAEFAVVLLGAGLDEARARAVELRRGLEAQPLAVAGGEVALRIGTAVHALRRDEAAEEALMASERDHIATGPVSDGAQG